VRKWAKKEHLSRIRASRRFRYTKELLADRVEAGDARRLVGLAHSFGGVAALLKHGLSEEEVGLTQLRRAAEKWLGGDVKPWHFSYRIQVGVK
ncbi:MAG: class I SAM-dependent methyltransferase, partial [Phycisphaerae bacterium]